MTCSTSGNDLSRIFSTSTTESLRHRHVEELNNGHSIDSLLHDAPRDSLLRPDVNETVRPRAPELRHAIVVEEEVLRAGLLGGGFTRNSAVNFVSYPPPGPGHALSPWGGVVLTLGQGHSDGHPLVAKPLTEPSLSPPLRGARDVFAIELRPHEDTTKNRQHKS